MKKTIVRAGIVALVALGLAMAANFVQAGGGGGQDGRTLVAPPHSNAFGKSLAEWSSTYWRWNYEGADISHSLISGLQMMPMPPAGDPLRGNGTPANPWLFSGVVEITLAPGTPFVLPEFAWICERYQGYPTIPDDVPFVDSVLLGDVHPTLTIDGKLVMSDANKADFYVPNTLFQPVVEYPTPSSYGSVAAVSFQGAAVVVKPMSPGVHVIQLYEPYIIKAGDYPTLPDGFGQVYSNLWIITVDQPPHVAPVNSKPFGKSYGEWSAKWWQWALSAPLANNPMADTTGAAGNWDQAGRVWFLAGTWGMPSAERTLTVPANTALFFPILNYVNISTPPDPAWDAPYLDTSVDPPVQYPSLGAYYRYLAKVAMDNVTGMMCQIDGWPVQNIEAFRCTSPEFMVSLPDANVFGIDKGVYGPSVSDGYFLMVSPLTAGQHQIHFKGGASDGSWGVDVIYHLNVSGKMAHSAKQTLAPAAVPGLLTSD